MKQIILIMLLFITFSNYSSAQKLPELEKVKEIKLLEHTRDDVRRILAEYKLENSASPNYKDIFETENAKIEISYSNGRCENAESNGWDVQEWKVTLITLTPIKLLKANQLNLNLSKFKTENVYTNQNSPKIHHRRDIGLALTINDTKSVIEVSLFPSNQYISILCDEAKIKRFLSTSSIFDPEFKERELISDYRATVNVTNLVLSASEITANCSNSDLGVNKSCSKSPSEITVLAVSENPDNDILTFNYAVTGGKIVGVDGKANYLSDKVF